MNKLTYVRDYTNTYRHLPANDQQQKERVVRQFDGNQSHAVASSADDEPVAELGTVHQLARGPPRDAGPHRQVRTTSFSRCVGLVPDWPRPTTQAPAQQAETGQPVAGHESRAHAAAPAPAQYGQHARDQQFQHPVREGGAAQNVQRGEHDQEPLVQ